MRDEVPTELAFSVVLERKGSVWLPRSVPEGLEFALVTSWSALRPGAHGVLEPDASIPPEPLEPGDVALVPGLAFDREGCRLGRGGGHYDRAFSSVRPRPRLFGVAFSWQVLDSLPCEPHDLRVDAVLTEAGLHPVGCPVEC